MTRLLMALIPLITIAYTNVSVSSELSAREIMEKVDNRYVGESSQADAKLILIDRRGRERTRDLKMYNLNGDDVDKSIIFFRSPADVSGTAYLNYDYADDRDDDSRLFLPALKQVRRVAAGDRSGSFMGSDFTYSDINGVTIDWYDYTILDAEAEVNGEPAWLIESTPKPDYADRVEHETGYRKSHLWILKDSFVQIQGKLWLTRGNRIKYFSASNLELIDNIWTPMRLQMLTTRNGEREHASIFQYSSVVYNQSTDESLFTTQAMEQGD
ncbi:outer membrane lipoprotein-sorting protein [Zobellella sp. DQSA1]|uniref:outer membrane lipoprotein-sorting protein n=1 Tax=Zobellella sp. DQSA1 TaxID=3342386 RepID=UPI0035BEED1F